MNGPARQPELPQWFRRPTGAPDWPGGEAGGTGGQGAKKTGGGSGRSARFIDKNLAAVASYTKRLLEGEEAASGKGVLQALDSRARIAGSLALVAAAALTSTAAGLAALLVIALVLAAASGVGPVALAKKMAPPFVLTLLLAVPAATGFITPGTAIVGGTAFGVDVTITVEGCRLAFFFILRVTTMASFVMLLFMVTRRQDFFMGLRALPVPGFFTTTLFVTFRYVFVLLKIIEDGHMARRSRTIAGTKAAESRRWLAGRLGYLLRRSVATAEDVTQAMISRGFDGRLRTFAPSGIRGVDLAWVGAVSFVFFLAAAF